jgi:histidinol dehydrogenase
MLVSNDPNGCSIDMPAGPSEVLIVADEKANPSFVAADLLSQAEHGADSLAVLVSTSVDTLEKTIKELYTQLEFLPRRKYALESISKSFALKVNTLEEAFEFSNNFAPEHLIIHANKAERFIKEVKNAGSVFVGEYSPESAGDYASGTNHSLPTYGFAKSIGGVSVMSFMKTITFQQLTEKGLVNLSNAIINLAEEEGLAAHANAVKIRLKK